jgi:hypothetical protein
MLDQGRELHMEVCGEPVSGPQLPQDSIEVRIAQLSLRDLHDRVRNQQREREREQQFRYVS